MREKNRSLSASRHKPGTPSARRLLDCERPQALLSPEQRAFLGRAAPRYVWWKTPDEAIGLLQHLLARIMDYGTLEDVIALRRLFGDEMLREVLRRSVIGQFRPRSWSFWHYQLGLAEFPEIPVPPLPTRRSL